MNTINSKKLALAFGTTGVLFYIGCMLIMLLVGQTGTTWFFNSLLHGLDVTTVSRMNVPAGQTIVGVLLTFGLGWLAGYLIAAIYNYRKIGN